MFFLKVASRPTSENNHKSDLIREQVWILKLAVYILLITCSVNGKEYNKIGKDADLEEDITFLKNSVAQYGPPVLPNYTLPGLELETDGNTRHNYEDDRSCDLNKASKYRIKSGNFSYLAYYTSTDKHVVGNKETIVVRGQISEKIPRKNGFYLRTLGYTLDEKGFRLFLTDVTKVVQKEIRQERKGVELEKTFWSTRPSSWWLRNHFPSRPNYFPTQSNYFSSGIG